MSNVTTQADPKNLTNVSDLARFLSIFQTSAINTINGNVEFGVNIKSTIVTTTLSNGKSVTVAHNLGRTPQGFILVGSNIAVNVYNTKASDGTYIYPIGTAAANVTLLVF
jgi:hypothetical protein